MWPNPMPNQQNGHIWTPGAGQNPGLGGVQIHKPLVAGAQINIVSCDQCGYINSADPTRVIVPSTDGIWIKSHGDTGQEVQTLVRLATPVRSLQGVALSIGVGTVTTTAAVVLQNTTCTLEGITTTSFDLSTINWNNRATLTYTSGLFRVATWSLNPLSAAGPASFVLRGSGAEVELACWAPITANSGGLTGVGVPGYPNPITGLRIRFGTLAAANLIYELTGGGGSLPVGKNVRVVPTALI